MPFNISDFRDQSQFSSLKSSRFEVLMFPPTPFTTSQYGLETLDSYSNFSDLAEGFRIKTEQVALPGASFAAVDNYSPYSTGFRLNIPYSTTVQPVTMTHVVDVDANIFQFINDWTNLIVDRTGNPSGSGQRPFDKSYSASYFDDYKSQIIIHVHHGGEGSGEYGIVKQIILRNAFPVSHDQLQFSWANNDELLRFSVQYAFSHYEVRSI